MCQRKNAELVEDLRSVGDGWKQPVKVVLVNTLGEEGDDLEERSGIGAKFLEHGGGERKFDRCCEALVMLCLQHTCSQSFPFPGQSVCAPLVVTRNSGEQGDRKWMEVKLVQDVVDQIGPFTVLVYAIEGIARSLN